MQNPIPVGPETQVNSNTDDHQFNVKMVGMANGGYFAVWDTFRLRGSENGPFGRIFNPDGTASAEFPLNTTILNSITKPNVTVLADETILVTWTFDGQLFGQAYTKFGAIAGPETILLSPSTEIDYRSVEITARNDGGFIATWKDFAESSEEIFAQIVGADGNPIGDVFRVNTVTDDRQFGSTITELENGDFVIVYTSFRPGTSYDLLAKQYDANGNLVKDEFPVNADTGGDQSGGDVTALPDGGYLITWSGHIPGGSSRQIIAKRYDADGNVVMPDFQVNTTDTGHKTSASVAVLADGGFIIAWASTFERGGNGQGVYGQRFNAAGEPVGDEFHINTHTADDQHLVEVTALADGGFVAAWISDEQDGDGQGIFLQQFAPQLLGTSDADEITDEIGANWISGLAGHDLINGGEGSDVIYGGRGRDTIFGGADSDTVYGDGGHDEISGDAGDDKLYGNSGHDTVTGGDGDDFIYGGSGNDTLKGDNGNDKILGGSGNDILSAGFLNGASDESNVLKGQRGSDALTGSNGSDKLFGGSDDDFLFGLGGNDFLYGDSGNDLIRGNKGNDKLFGGSGADQFEFGVDSGFDIVRDFEDDVDTILLHSALWNSEELTTQEVVDTFGRVNSGHAVLVFDGGERVKILGVDDLSLLVDDIQIIG